MDCVTFNSHHRVAQKNVTKPYHQHCEEILPTYNHRFFFYATAWTGSIVQHYCKLKLDVALLMHGKRNSETNCHPPVHWEQTQGNIMSTGKQHSLTNIRLNGVAPSSFMHTGSLW